jgi:ribonuclease HII
MDLNDKTSSDTIIKTKSKPELKQYFMEGDIEIGLDEVGRGCLAGPVVCAGCIWLNKEDPENIKKYDIRDSKKLTKKKRKESYEYIKQNAICYSIKFGDNHMVDKYNVLKTTKLLMHECLRDIEEQLKGKKINTILVDGPHFDMYLDKDFEYVQHKCIVNGDNIYKSIAAASILAKECRDNYMIKLTENNPDFFKYGWMTNMAYGTKQHLDAIKEHGITKFHRKTFGICKNY